MRPGWPLELEVLSLVFAFVAAIVPFYVAYLSEPPSVPTLLQQALGQPVQARLHFIHLKDIAWAGFIAFACVWLILVARRGVDTVSTPFTHLVAPLFFSFIAYYRLYEVPRNASEAGISIVIPGAGHILAWAAGVTVIILLLGRLRMARYALSFRDVTWDVSTPTRHDATFRRLALRVLPLIYEPRLYRACDKGITVEGWFYIMVIPFNLVQSISETGLLERIPPGNYFATSTTRMIRIQMTEWPLPFYLSPQDHEEFFTYCTQRIRRIHRQTTLAGLATVHDVSAERQPVES